MQRRPLFWQIFPLIFLTVLVSLIAIFSLAYKPIDDFIHKKMADDLGSRLAIVAAHFTLKDALKESELAEHIQILGKHSKTRFTVLDKDGNLLVDTEPSAEAGYSLLDRPEVVQALNDGRGFSIRRSSLLGKEMMYKSQLVELANSKTYLIRVSISLEDAREKIMAVYMKVIFGGFALLIVVALISYVVSKQLSSPMEKMKHQAERIARGDFSGRVHLDPFDTDEVHKLGQAMNEIAVQLDYRIETILNQKNERDAILSSMVEGVLAVDPSEKIVHMNKAAAEILEVTRDDCIGKSVHEAIRVPKIQEVIEKSLAKELPEEFDISIHVQGKNKVLDVQSSPLRSSNNKKLGAVFVFSDITKMNQLESHRREFVANVSHELRTPLTSITGFAETLINNPPEVEQQGKFLRIIYKHAKRLNEIIEDLLSLSRLEKDSDDIELREGELWPTLVSAKELCEMKTSNMGVEVHLGDASSTRAHINGPLLEQALVNLIDNATKYSNKGDQIHINLRENGQEVYISVKDQGTGIDSEHLPRLFERFYRVDKARSRDQGGTGLGLSIVKHVALAHKGRVDVESQVGKGSTFYIILPKI